MATAGIQRAAEYRYTAPRICYSNTSFDKETRSVQVKSYSHISEEDRFRDGENSVSDFGNDRADNDSKSSLSECGEETDDEFSKSPLDCSLSSSLLFDDVPRTPRRPFSILDPSSPSLLTEGLFVTVGVAALALGGRMSYLSCQHVVTVIVCICVAVVCDKFSLREGGSR
ncbi:unnamed protein product [Enterobius vermicularis]|uniref:Pecanex-like protein n=1 Tax=Enterobius vermicularis TaxID=51028 RepID=A0A0N4VA61_ENTVE|nr:unnamed protein product [Enterobius vermicularis]